MAELPLSREERLRLWFAILFLAPDLSMLGYFLNRKIGAMLYNAGHSYLLPIVMFSVSQYYAADLGTSLSLIWLGHIGFDRVVGYGLKYQSGFKDTHLGTPFSNARKMP